MLKRFGLLLISFTFIFFVTAAQAKNGGGKGRTTHERVVLKATNSNTNAGFAEIFLKTKKKRTDQSFHVQVNNIPANTTFSLMVDGKTIDTFTSTPGGTFEMLFANNSKASHQPLPASLNPVTNIKHVEIKATTGQTVAGGAFGSDEGDMEREIALSSTGIIPNAKGEAKIEIEKDDGGDDDSGDDDEDGNG